MICNFRDFEGFLSEGVRLDWDALDNDERFDDNQLLFPWPAKQLLWDMLSICCLLLPVY
jgi:hypothetical protein